MNLSLSLFLLLPLPQLPSSFFQFSGFIEAFAEYPPTFIMYCLQTTCFLFYNGVLAREGLCTGPKRLREQESSLELLGGWSFCHFIPEAQAGWEEGGRPDCSLCGTLGTSGEVHTEEAPPVSFSGHIGLGLVGCPQDFHLSPKRAPHWGAVLSQNPSGPPGTAFLGSSEQCLVSGLPSSQSFQAPSRAVFSS